MTLILSGLVLRWLGPKSRGAMGGVPKTSYFGRFQSAPLAQKDRAQDS
jgi:hypothetical protein